MENLFSQKSLLITGGTGSFGNAVLRRILNTEIKEIRIFSRDEKKQDDMRQLYNNPKIKYYIGDVRSFESINSAMKGVDYVFKAGPFMRIFSSGSCSYKCFRM
jgi:UDP-glucose 4-epimerase